MELLNLAAVQHHLELAGEEEALAQLADAIRQSGLTHGIDAADRGAGGDTGTWRAALDRLVAGAWFGQEAARISRRKPRPRRRGRPHRRDEISLRFVGWLGRLACHLQTWPFQRRRRTGRSACSRPSMTCSPRTSTMTTPPPWAACWANSPPCGPTPRSTPGRCSTGWSRSSKMPRACAPAWRRNPPRPA